MFRKILDFEIEIIRSNRRTLSIKVVDDGRILVRAPLRMSERQIMRYVYEKQDWIEHTMQKLAEERFRMESIPKFTESEMRKYILQAKEVIPQRVEYYARQMGVSYARISIRSQRTRWGSCSGKGNLNFNCLLVLTPPEVLDYVVVHELCHLREMNHSVRFWQQVESVLPDYKVRRKWLKMHGGELIERLP